MGNTLLGYRSGYSKSGTDGEGTHSTPRHTNELAYPFKFHALLMFPVFSLTRRNSILYGLAISVLEGSISRA